MPPASPRWAKAPNGRAHYFHHAQALISSCGMVRLMLAPTTLEPGDKSPRCGLCQRIEKVDQRSARRAPRSLQSLLEDDE